MGTNYYLFTKDKSIREKYSSADYSLTDEPDFGYILHLAKLSGGWFPIFQAHRGMFESYRELQAVVATGMFVILSEYNEKFTWKEFDAIVQEWIHSGNSLQSHLNIEVDNRWLIYYQDQDGYEFIEIQSS